MRVVVRALRHTAYTYYSMGTFSVNKKCSVIACGSFRANFNLSFNRNIDILMYFARVDFHRFIVVRRRQPFIILRSCMHIMLAVRA